MCGIEVVPAQTHGGCGSLLTAAEKRIANEESYGLVKQGM